MKPEAVTVYVKSLPADTPYAQMTREFEERVIYQMAVDIDLMMLRNLKP